MTPDQQDVYDLKQQGKTLAEIAGVLGISEECAKSRWKRAKRNASQDPAIKRAMAAIGTGMTPSVVWDKTQPGYSVLLRPDAESTKKDWAEIFADIPSYHPPIVHARFVSPTRLNVYPLYDAHIGMMSWGRETRGQDYDLSLAAQDMQAAFQDVADMAPDADNAMLILGGDTLHIDDFRNETPGSGHKLDADGRYEKVIDSAITMIAHSIEYLAEKHKHLDVVVIRGNHDENSHVALKVALKQRYRNTPNISFPVMTGRDKSEIYWQRFGNSLIAIHHGDKSPPQRLAMIIADQCEHWSSTRDRHILTGHKHHLHVQDFPGVVHHTLRAFCPPDSYGAMFGGKRALTCMTFDHIKGLINTAMEPVLR